MKPNFTAMTREALKQYLLIHRNDEEAFFAYVIWRKAQLRRNRSETGANWVVLPPVESIEEPQQFPGFLKRIDTETKK